MSGGPGTVRVFLLDDQAAVRAALRDLVERSPGLELVGEAGTAIEAISRLPGLRPDVVVLDVRLPDGSGIEVCRRVRSLDPAIGALLLTSYDDDDAVLAAVLAGAAGYVLKDIRNLDLVARIRSAAAGRPVIDPETLDRVRVRLRSGRGWPGAGALTRDERRVLRLIADELTDREIAERLAVTDARVHEHVAQVLAALAPAPGSAHPERATG